MTQGALKHFPPLIKLLTVIILALTGSLLVSVLSALIAKPVFGIDIYSIQGFQNHINFLRFVQILQSIFVFILPSALSVHLLYSSKDKVIPGKGKFTFPFFVIAIVGIFLSQHFISWTANVNQQIQLPGFMQQAQDWMTSMEEEAAEITDMMLQSYNWKHTLLTVFIIGVLPAIGEEWLFRGLIQRELMNVFKNAHLAVLATAIIFSAIHIQFLTFLPRFVLGVILGYMMVYSRNIWMPITAHFTNNFLAIIFYKLYTPEGTQLPETIPDYPFNMGVVFSLLFVITLILVTRWLGMKYADSV